MINANFGTLVEIKMNRFEDKLDFEGIDFSLATHLKNTYSCRIFKASDGNIKLSYIDGAGDLIVVNVNA